ncbi:hypothetical protein ES703_05584 [subsurface metagenome]|nr:hypothetical protein [bacterium]TET23367.1 MAG: hypothetical protein E3J71_03115 [Candidatus Stahlbacteria bacterium]
MNNQLQRLTRLAEILGRDRRYKLEAYLFVIEALHYELKRLGVDSPDKRRHLTARELLEGIRALGWERYGRLAKQVFESWGVRSTRDFGEIVFNLIEAGEFTKTDEDRKEDFVGVFDFDRDLVNAYPLGDASKD